MKNKLAVIKSGFMEEYLDSLLKLCDENGVQCDILDQVPDFNQYDYVLTDCMPKVGVANVFHTHSPVYKAKLGNIFYRVCFLLGRALKINRYRRLLLSCSKVFAVSSIVKNDFIENFGVPAEKIVVVYPGFNFQCDNDLKEIPKFDKNNTFNISMSAQGFIAKGGYIMLDALRIFRKLYPDVKIKLNIIYPKHKNNLGVNLYIRMFGLKDYVELHGRQENMTAYYDKADCFICPSLYEAFGRVVTEAMYAKRPVILASNVGAIDVVKDGVNAFVYEAGKKGAYNLACKIKEVYDNYNELDSVIENAYELSKKFTWENFAKQIFEGLYGANK